MNSFDTLKLCIPLNNMKYFDKKCFEIREKKHISDDNIEIVERKYHLIDKYRFKGLSQLTINKEKKEILIVISGKIIDHHQIINKKNINLVYKKLNTEYFKLKDIEIAINESKVLRCDVTKNIPIENVGLLINLLNECHLHHKWNKTLYKSESIVFQNGNKTSNERCIIYDKQKEIMKDKSLTAEQKSEMINIARMEFNLRKFRVIEKRLGIDKLDLVSILNSERNVLLDFINELIIEKKNILNGIKKNNLKEYHSELARIYLLKKCNWDLKEVRNVISSISKKNLKKVMSGYEITKNTYKRKKVDFLDDFIDKLKKIA